MERRSCARKPVEVSVYFSNAEHQLSRCRATDISASGVFLQGNPIFIPRHKCLKLMFALRVGSSNLVRLRRVTAIVTRSQPDGVGMMFCASGKRQRAKAVGS
ncbi:MAG: PilZ domain-containing protein [Gammaproteobacteria bacterium]|jgi:hypothetical protein